MKIKDFATYDVDLAAYLMSQGLKFIECKADIPISGKPRVLMRFFDEKETARDLERAFMNSEIKRFGDFRRYLLKEVHRTLK